MDEKEKKTAKKTTNTKKTSSTTKKSVAAKKETTPKKSTTSKSVSSATKKTADKPVTKAATKSTAKSTTKKTTAKASVDKPASTAKKTASKKATTKKTTTKKTPSPKIEVEEVETKNLEHTIIFDGLENQNISDVVNNLEEENVVVDDKVIKRSKVRKVIIIILYLLIIAVIIATTVYILKENNKKKMVEEPIILETINSNIYKKANDYYDNSNEIAKEEIDPKSSYSNIVNIGLSSFEKMALEKKDAHILVASSTCYYCAIFEETVNDAYKENNKKIYRLDITKLTDDEVAKFRQYYAFRSTPTIFSIKDGIIKSDVVGTTSKENLINWIKENK